MEDERPELAMEISTKFGLETQAIWTYWGLTCIRKADYMGARDKFSKFMKVRKLYHIWLLRKPIFIHTRCSELKMTK